MDKSCQICRMIWVGQQLKLLQFVLYQWPSPYPRPTHLQNNFFMLTFSYKAVSTLPYDIFTMATISCNFVFRLSKIIFQIFFFFDGLRCKAICLQVRSIQHHRLSHDLVQDEQTTDILLFMSKKVAKILFKPMLRFFCNSFFSYFFIKKQYLNNTRNSNFFIVLKVASLKRLVIAVNESTKGHEILTEIISELTLPKNEYEYFLRKDQTKNKNYRIPSKEEEESVLRENIIHN